MTKEIDGAAVKAVVVELVRKLPDGLADTLASQDGALETVARAALTASRAQDDGWQDISTAPKDERVLVYGVGCLPCDFPDPDIERDAYDWYIAAWVSGDWHTDGDEWVYNVTHWRPLPAAPLRQQEGG